MNLYKLLSLSGLALIAQEPISQLFIFPAPAPFSAAVIALGAVLFLGGMVLWYWNIQRHQDAALAKYVRRTPLLLLCCLLFSGCAGGFSGVGDRVAEHGVEYATKEKVIPALEAVLASLKVKRAEPETTSFVSLDKGGTVTSFEGFAASADSPADVFTLRDPVTGQTHQVKRSDLVAFCLAHPKAEFVDIDKAKGASQVAAGNPRVRCLLFTSDGCEPCIRLERAIQRDLVPKGWTMHHGANADIQVVNIDSDELAKKFSISSTPTLILVTPALAEIKRSGGMATNTLADWINGARLQNETNSVLRPWIVTVPDPPKHGKCPVCGTPMVCGKDACFCPKCNPKMSVTTQPAVQYVSYPVSNCACGCAGQCGGACGCSNCSCASYSGRQVYYTSSGDGRSGFWSRGPVRRWVSRPFRGGWYPGRGIVRLLRGRRGC